MPGFPARSGEMSGLSFKTPAGVMEYTITHRPRVTRNLHLELDERGGLVVVVPRHWSKRYINATLLQNSRRVERFLLQARSRQLQALQYAPGEQHLFLGESYPLVIGRAAGRKNRVCLVDDEICIQAVSPTAEKIQALLQNWYQQQAMIVFGERLRVLAGQVPWARERDIPLRLRRMKRTWGNCSAGGAIKLNTHLVKAPQVLIDAVIAHELCHLEEMNHGRAFYRLLGGLNPHWRRDRTRLRAEGYRYLRT